MRFVSFTHARVSPAPYASVQRVVYFCTHNGGGNFQLGSDCLYLLCWHARQITEFESNAAGCMLCVAHHTSRGSACGTRPEPHRQQLTIHNVSYAR